MRHSFFCTALLMAGVLVPTLADPALAQTPPSSAERPASQPSMPITSELDAASGMNFRLFLEGDEMVVRGEAANVRIEKRNRRGGATTITIADASELVTLRVDAQAIVAERQGREARMDLGNSPDTTGPAAIRSLLQDSPAVAAIDRLAARLEVRSTQVSLVESLRQVHTWTRRLRGRPVPAHSLVAGLPAPGVRLVRTGGAGVSCWMSYEHEIWDAYMDFSDCYVNSWESPYGGYVRDACGLLYYMRAESAWFELMSCVAFPW